MSDQKGFLRSIMSGVKQLLPADPSGELATAVRAYHKVLSIKDLFQGNLLNRLWNREQWPVTAGNYLIGDPTAPVAICTLTSPELMEPLQKTEGTAIAGRLVTANLGIEKIIRNVIANPNIRYLLLCGDESPVFHPGQTLQSLCEKGIDPDHRIIGAKGHYPVLINIGRKHIEHFRSHIALINCTGEVNLDALQQTIMRLARQPAPKTTRRDISADTLQENKEATFTPLRPGGPRGTAIYDPKGFFVITLDHAEKEILVRHYHADHKPVHEVRGRRAEGILGALNEAELLSQLSHAGYLGVELGKAETALRLGVDYEQDHPIQPRE